MNQRRRYRWKRVAVKKTQGINLSFPLAQYRKPISLFMVHIEIAYRFSIWNDYLLSPEDKGLSKEEERGRPNFAEANCVCHSATRPTNSAFFPHHQPHRSSLKNDTHLSILLQIALTTTRYVDEYWTPCLGYYQQLGKITIEAFWTDNDGTTPQPLNHLYLSTAEDAFASNDAWTSFSSRELGIPKTLAASSHREIYRDLSVKSIPP